MFEAELVCLLLNFVSPLFTNSYKPTRPPVTFAACVFQEISFGFFPETPKDSVGFSNKSGMSVGAETLKVSDNQPLSRLEIQVDINRES